MPVCLQIGAGIAALLCAGICSAGTVTSAQSGLWNAGATWVGGNAPKAGDTVVIANTHTVTVNTNVAVDEVVVNAGGVLQGDGTTRNFSYGKGGGVDFTVNGTLDFGQARPVTLVLEKNSIWGGTGTWNVSQINVQTRSLTLTTFTNTLNFSGNATPITGTTGTIISGVNTTWNFTGTVAQTLPATIITQYGNITVNNPNGITLSVNTTVTTLLTLANGALTTGASTLIVNANCPASVARTNGHVRGNLRLTFPTAAGTTTCIYPVGDSIGYAPITVALTGATTGTLTGRVDSGDHADTTAGTSGIDKDSSANHFWTLTAGTLVTYTSYAATFQFCATGVCVTPTEIDATAAPAAFIVARKSAGTWTYPIVGTAAATSTQATGITSAQGFGEFAVGQPAGVNHFFINHDGDAVNCQAESITISVHNASHTIQTSYTGTISLTTSTNRGDWSLVTGSGILTNGAANDGAATYTYALTDAGVVVLSLKDTTPETLNINVAAGLVTEQSGTAAADVPYDTNLVFAPAGFRFTDGGSPPAAATIVAQTAGAASATYGLQAIRTDTSTGACVGVFASGTDVAIDLASQCNDPVTCAGQQVSISNNAITNTIASNPDSGVSSYTSRSLRFGANSQALFTLTYPDVGKISLHARYTIPLGSGGASATNMMGSSNMFVVKPFGFVLSNIQATTLAGRCTVNPNSIPACATDATGARFAKAGENFSATVTAIKQGGGATPNYGNEVAAEGVTLTRALVEPGGGANGMLVNPAGFGAFTNGVATGTTFKWSEVGIITLTPSVADTDYLGAGDVSGTISGNVGRFYPDHFLLTAGTLNNRSALACVPPSSFTYAGETLQIASFKLTAYNGLALPTVTTNYNTTSGFSKLDGSTFADFNFGAIDLVDTIAPLTATALTSSLNGTSSGSWLAGVGTFTANLSLTRATSPDGPYESLNLGIDPADSDGVKLSSYNLDTSVPSDGNDRGLAAAATKVRFGRLKLSNAHGSEQLALPVPVEAQYWNDIYFAVNTDDQCTRILSGTVTLSNYLLNLIPCETAITGVTLTAGKALLGLSKPKPGSDNNGSVDLRINLDAASGNTCLSSPGAESSATSAAMPYLRGAWNGTDYDDDPGARATFGVYKGSNAVIDIRESH